jgi:hypothetical protein
MATDADTELRAMRRLWAAKLLVHAKDYAAGVRAMGGHKISTTTKSVGNSVELARRAYSWMTSPDDSPASFSWICDIFELDPERTSLKIIHGWREFLVVNKRDAVPINYTLDEEEDE